MCNEFYICEKILTAKNGRQILFFWRELGQVSRMRDTFFIVWKRNLWKGSARVCTLMSSSTLNGCMLFFCE